MIWPQKLIKFWISYFLTLNRSEYGEGRWQNIVVFLSQYIKLWHLIAKIVNTLLIFFVAMSNKSGSFYSNSIPITSTVGLSLAQQFFTSNCTAFILVYMVSLDTATFWYSSIFTHVYSSIPGGNFSTKYFCTFNFLF